jgi:hypothetical protein
VSPSRRNAVALHVGLALSAAPGCVSYGSHLSATPTAEGELEYSVNADAVVLDRGAGPQILPNPELSIRRGFGQEFDLGLRLNALGAEATSRIGLLDLARYRLTSVPLLGGGFVPATNKDTGLATTTAGVILLNGITIAPRTELVVGVRGQARLDLNAVAIREDFGAATWRFVPGGSFGVRFPVSQRLFLFPEVVVLAPYNLENGAFESPIVQGGVGLQWGSHGKSSRAQPPPP